MTRSLLLLPLSLVLTSLGIAGPVQGATVEDFEGAPEGWATTADGDHGTCEVLLAEVLDDGDGDSYLRLVEAGSRNCDSLTFDATDPGPWPTVEAGFDFRIVPPEGKGAADGLGFVLLDTGIFGETGSVAGDAEEPAFAGSLGVGFDVYNNFDDGSGATEDEVPGGGDHVSIYFDEEFLGAFASPVPLTSDGGWFRASVVLADDLVSVTVTPPGGSAQILVDDFSVPGLTPYASRAYFGARSGGLSADHDLDDIEVEWSEGDPPDDDHPGEWGDVMPLASVTIHLVLLPSYEMLFWGRYEDEKGWYGELYRWDPRTGESYQSAQPGYDAFCVGHSQLADGRILMTGGHLGPEPLDGLPNASIYDPYEDSFEMLPDMNAARWYPSNLLLPNGDTLVIGGSIDTEILSNPLPQVLDSETWTWRHLTGAVRPTKLYPWMYLVGEERAFIAGPDGIARYLDTAGEGAWTEVAANAFGERDSGTSVRYGPTQFAIFGGTRFDPEPLTTNTVEVIDLADPEPQWREVEPMTWARRHVNSTLLPDGTVFIAGGTSGNDFNDGTQAVLPTELWDPETETFRTTASLSLPRLYHSTALLMPDARVMMSGGGWPGEFTNANVEFYSPPYLFDGDRPTIAAAPNWVEYGGTIEIETPDAAAVTDVVLMRVASVTHSFNPEQHRVPLAFTNDGDGTLTANAPADFLEAAAGWWLLFLLDDGVPSEATFLKLGGDPPVEGDDDDSGDDDDATGDDDDDATGDDDDATGDDDDDDGCDGCGSRVAGPGAGPGAFAATAAGALLALSFAVARRRRRGAAPAARRRRRRR